ncbi:hypothetical protein VTO73DRAFT_12973 [Trametes versicolor]
MPTPAACVPAASSEEQRCPMNLGLEREGVQSLEVFGARAHRCACDSLKPSMCVAAPLHASKIEHRAWRGQPGVSCPVLAPRAL